jgi:hypothetical protein
MPWLPYSPAGSSLEAAASKPASPVALMRCSASSLWHGRVRLSAGTFATSAIDSPGGIASRCSWANGSCCTVSPQ